MQNKFYRDKFEAEMLDQKSWSELDKFVKVVEREKSPNREQPINLKKYQEEIMAGVEGGTKILDQKMDLILNESKADYEKNKQKLEKLFTDKNMKSFDTKKEKFYNDYQKV